MDSPDPPPDRAVDRSGERALDHDVEDPSGLVAKLRALGRGSSDGAGEAEDDGGDFRTRIFGSPTYFRLWTAQAITSMGDWLGFLAIVVLASRIGGTSSSSSVGLVMAARIVPGFFFSAAAGVLIDRMDRKQVMVVTTMVRAGVVAVLPFVDSVWGLVFASLVLELATLMFSPAKEATVPNLVPTERLASANSLSLAAAYGTFPIAAALFALLAQFAEWLRNFSALEGMSQATVAFYVNALCYIGAALIITRLQIPKDHIRLHEDDETAIDLGDAFREIKEGWHYAFINPVVRAVNVGLATGLIGGGMLVPLGDTFATTVLGAGASGFGVFVTALGLGVGAGILVISARQATINKQRLFVLSVFGAGVTLIVGASMWTLELAALSVFVMGIFAGSVYVLGFTLLHENVDDELRGRVFAGLYTLVRLCLLLSMALGPFLADLLDGLSDSLFDGKINVGIEISIPGVRLTLWLAGSIMLVAAVLAAKSLRPQGSLLRSGRSGRSGRSAGSAAAAAAKSGGSEPAAAESPDGDVVRTDLVHEER
jgi:MFS family permease